MRVAELVVRTRLSDVTPQATRVAKDVLLDTVGVTLGGCTQPAVEKVIGFARAMGGTPSATVIGTGLETSPLLAALVNGTSAATLDYDETSWRGFGHFSGSIFAAALALAEARRLSGYALLESFIIGYEAANKIGRGLQPGQYVGGRHTTGTLGVLGATAACAKLLGLNANRTAVAFGVAASSAGAIRGNFGTMTKGLHTGFAASNAIMAASLAAAGFTARPDILEATYGYAETTVKDGSYKLDEIGKDWGEPWDFVEPGPGIKFQPSGSMSLCAGQIAMELAVQQDIRPAEIQTITCRTSEAAIDTGHFRVPRDAFEAQYSIAWAIAVALADRRRGLAQFSDDRVKDQALLALAAKIDVRSDPEFTASPGSSDLPACELIVVMKDGREFRRLQHYPVGYPGGDPWTDEMLEDKFREVAGLALGSADVERTITMLRSIDQIPDIRDLTRVLVRRSEAS